MVINGFELVAWTQHWRLVDGTWRRDAIARRLTDGALRIVSVRDES